MLKIGFFFLWKSLDIATDMTIYDIIIVCLVVGGTTRIG